MFLWVVAWCLVLLGSPDFGSARLVFRDAVLEEDDQYYQEHENNLDDFVHKFADQLFIPPNNSSGLSYFNICTSLTRSRFQKFLTCFQET
jgi:hypothetical protein